MSTIHQEENPFQPDGNKPDVSQETLFDLSDAMPTVSHSGQLPVEEGGERPGTREFDNTSLSEAVAQGHISSSTLPDSPSSLIKEPSATASTTVPAPEADDFFTQMRQSRTTTAPRELERKHTKRNSIIAGAALGTLLVGGLAAKAVGGNNSPDSRTASDSPTAPVVPGTTAAVSPNASTPTAPAETDPANIPTTNAVVPPIESTPDTTAQNPDRKVEKGSVEYYEVTVADNPTPEDAVQSFGELLEKFVTSGKANADGSAEAPDSLHADDNMLLAFFGSNAEDANANVIEAWRKTRLTIARGREVINDITSGSAQLEYSLNFLPVADSAATNGNQTTIDVNMNSASNASMYLDADYSEQGSWTMTLEQVPDDQGAIVWHVLRIDQRADS